MSKNENEISFDDPEDELLESDKAPQKSHQELVSEIQKDYKQPIEKEQAEKRAEKRAALEKAYQEEMAKSNPVYAVKPVLSEGVKETQPDPIDEFIGKVEPVRREVSRSQILFETNSEETNLERCVRANRQARDVDPESMNFLLSRQKIHLQTDPEGAVTVGGSVRDLRLEELEEVLELELACPFCSEPFIESDCDYRELGQLVYYGTTPEGHRQVWHWECLGLQMLLSAKGHPEKGAQMFNVDLRDMRALKSQLRSIPWGRLGYLPRAEQLSIPDPERRV